MIGERHGQKKERPTRKGHCQKKQIPALPKKLLQEVRTLI
jgi:hypothetical protein